MAYILYCREAGFDCNTVVTGDTSEEILHQVRSHATADHGVTVTPVLTEQIRALIKVV